MSCRLFGLPAAGGCLAGAGLLSAGPLALPSARSVLLALAPAPRIRGGHDAEHCRRQREDEPAGNRTGRADAIR
jgi:hypothetical protein